MYAFLRFALRHPFIVFLPSPSAQLTASPLACQFSEGMDTHKACNPSHNIILKIAVRSPRHQGFWQLAINIATPGYTDYGRHLTCDAVS